MKTMCTPRMRKRKNRPKVRLILVLAAILGVGLGVVAAPSLRAEGPGAETPTKVPKPRTIEGVVISKSGAPVQGAVVYLKDRSSMAVRSYLSEAGGTYHFRQLSMNTDYELWAELHGRRSKTHSISHFNSKNDLHYTLKLPNK